MIFAKAQKGGQKSPEQVSRKVFAAVSIGK
jgi:hypothetical protein